MRNKFPYVFLVYILPYFLFGQETTWPVPGITSIVGDFGEFRPDHFHAGLDIGAPGGTTLVASGPGSIIEVGTSTSYGDYVYIQHDSGNFSLYAHCDPDTISNDPPLSEINQHITAGTPIGVSGNTGPNGTPYPSSL